jgi:hypothetical protein
MLLKQQEEREKARTAAAEANKAGAGAREVKAAIAEGGITAVI